MDTKTYDYSWRLSATNTKCYVPGHGSCPPFTLLEYLSKADYFQNLQNQLSGYARQPPPVKVCDH